MGFGHHEHELPFPVLTGVLAMNENQIRSIDFILDELARRQGLSGLVEKANRSKEA